MKTFLSLLLLLLVWDASPPEEYVTKWQVFYRDRNQTTWYLLKTVTKREIKVTVLSGRCWAVKAVNIFGEVSPISNTVCAP